MSDGAIVVTNPRDITDHSLATMDDTWWRDWMTYMATLQFYEDKES